MKKASVSALLAVLCFHTAVLAQQSPAPAPPSPPPSGASPAAPAPAPAPAPPPPAVPQQPPPPAYPVYPYGPPPGYGTPPLPPPQPQPLPPSYYYYQPPAPRGVWRPFTISLGLGFGLLSSPGDFDSRDNDGSLDYLARIGFGVTRDWVVFLGLDGASVSTQARDVTVTNYLLGAQYFIASRFYLRAGLGLATFSEDSVEDFYSTAGQGFLGAAGAELVQGENVAFGIEFVSALSRSTWHLRQERPGFPLEFLLMSTGPIPHPKQADLLGDPGAGPVPPAMGLRRGTRLRPDAMTANKGFSGRLRWFQPVT